MTFQVSSMWRTFSTSRIQRLVTHANGHSGSNQKSTERAVDGVVDVMSPIFPVADPHRHHRGW